MALSETWNRVEFVGGVKTALLSLNPAERYLIRKPEDKGLDLTSVYGEKTIVLPRSNALEMP